MYRYQKSKSTEEFYSFPEGSNDIAKDEAEAFLSKLSRLDYLLSASKAIFPLGYLPTPKEISSIERFRLSSWRLIATLFDSEGEFVSFLLVDKENPTFALVLDGKSGKIIQEIHGIFEVYDDMEGACFPISSYLARLGYSLSASFKPSSQGKPQSLGYAKDDIEEDGDGEDSLDMDAINSIARPSFESRSSFKPKNLGNPVDDKEREIELEESEDEPEKVDLASLKTSFFGNSNKKPKNLDFRTRAPRPIPSSAPASKDEEEEAPAEIDVSSLKQSFSGNSNKKPKNLGSRTTFSKPTLLTPIQKQEGEEEEPAPSTDWKKFRRFESATKEKPTKIENSVAPKRKAVKQETKPASKDPSKEIARPEGWKEEESYSLCLSSQFGHFAFKNDEMAPIGKTMELVAAFSSLKSVKSINVSPKCVFSPKFLPLNDNVFKALSNFSIDAWDPLASSYDFGFKFNCIAIYLKSNPEFVVVLKKNVDKSFGAIAISSKGISLKSEEEEISFAKLLSLAEIELKK